MSERPTMVESISTRSIPGSFLRPSFSWKQTPWLVFAACSGEATLARLAGGRRRSYVVTGAARWSAPWAAFVRNLDQLVMAHPPRFSPSCRPCHGFLWAVHNSHGQILPAIQAWLAE